MFLSVCTFSVMDLLVKWSSDYPTGEVLFFRGFFGLLPTYFLIPKNKLKTFYTTERSKEHLFRCLMGLMALIAIVVALRELPLAVVVSLSYAAPLFITVLSIFLLSEKVGVFRDQKLSLVNLRELLKLKLVIVVVTAKQSLTKRYVLAIQIMQKLLS